MHGKVFNEIVGQVQGLRSLCDIQAVEYMTKISTLEVTVGQQTIQLRKAQEVVEDNIQTILRLQEEVKDLGQVKSYLLDERDSLFNALIVIDPHYVPDSVSVDVQDLMEERGEYPMENCGSCDQQGINEHCIEHHDLAQGTIYAKCQEGCNEPEPYPYTHPIRDVPDYSKVKRSS